MADNEARQAARQRAAQERAAAARRKRRNRVVGVVAAVVVVLGVAGGVTAAVVSGAQAASAQQQQAQRTAAEGRTSAPPWAAPADVEARVTAAGLSMLTAEGTALHIHQHLSITVDGKAVTVPALLGIDEEAQRISPLHTHDTSGIIHVESPVQATFRLGQVFEEWDVHLATGRLGSYRAGRDGVRIGLFVNGKPHAGDPTRLRLASHQDIDFVITTDGTAPAAPAKRFTFPAGY